MVKKEKGSEELEQNIRRGKNIEYQNRRKEKLNELGEYKLSIRLDNPHYEKLSDLCEVLGYRRPKRGKYNLIETYSEVIKYLLRVSDDLIEYEPKSDEAKELLQLHKLVNHLKHDKNYSDENVLSELRSKGIQTPLSPLNNTVIKSRNGRLPPLDNEVIRHDKGQFLRELLRKDIVIEKMIEIDNYLK
jgi:hypothetical protein